MDVQWILLLQMNLNFSLKIPNFVLTELTRVIEENATSRPSRSLISSNVSTKHNLYKNQNGKRSRGINEDTARRILGCSYGRGSIRKDVNTWTSEKLTAGKPVDGCTLFNWKNLCHLLITANWTISGRSLIRGPSLTRPIQRLIGSSSTCMVSGL